MKDEKNSKPEAVGKRRKRRYTLLKILAAAAALFAVLSAVSFPMKTVHYEVTAPGISKPLRIVQISDLHSEYYGRDMKNLIYAVDAAAPDIIVLTGDIYDDILPKDNVTALLSDIGRRYPCYYVAGNHEFHNSKWAEKHKPEAEALGVHVLEGENVTVGDITLCGAARAADGSVGWGDSVEKCAEEAWGYSVLLCHLPEDIDYYRSFGKFDLILSGHAHGGQWRLPFSQNGLFSPGEGLFPKYSGGRFDFDDCTMIVSRGLARIKTVIPRIFNNPELVVIDLLPRE